MFRWLRKIGKPAPQATIIVVDTITGDPFNGDEYRVCGALYANGRSLLVFGGHIHEWGLAAAEQSYSLEASSRTEAGGGFFRFSQEGRVEPTGLSKSLGGNGLPKCLHDAFRRHIQTVQGDRKRGPK